MAKRGLMYYVVIGSGFLPLIYLYYWDKKTYNRKKQLEQDQILNTDKIKKRVTAGEQRLMGERMVAKEVPVSDEENGYM